MGLKPRRGLPQSEPTLIRCPEVCVFGRLRDDADAAALLDAVDRFRGRHAGAITYQDYGAGRWSGASTRMWERLRDAIGSAAARARTRLAVLHLHGGARHDAAVTPAIDVFTDSVDGCFALRWLCPVDAPSPELLAVAADLTERTSIVWGYAGRGVYGPGYSDATGGRHDPVGDALQADPYLGPAHPILWGQAHLGVCNLGWITMLGPTVLARLGGADDVARRLAAVGFTVDRVGAAMMFRLGEAPDWSDGAAAPMAAAWSSIAGARAPNAALDDSWVAGLTLEEMGAWVHRFERA